MKIWWKTRNALLCLSAWFCFCDRLIPSHNHPNQPQSIISRHLNIKSRIQMLLSSKEVINFPSCRKKLHNNSILTVLFFQRGFLQLIKNIQSSYTFFNVCFFLALTDKQKQLYDNQSWKVFFSSWKIVLKAFRFLSGFLSNVAKIELMLKVVRTLRSGFQGRKHQLLIFVDLNDFLKSIEQSLTEQAIPFASISRETSIPEKMKLLEEFQDAKVTILVGTFYQMAQGLNLTAATAVLNMEPSQSPHFQSQAIWQGVVF